VVLAPLLLAAFDGPLPIGAAAGLCAAGVLLVSVDALLTEALQGRVAVAGALAIAAIMAGLVFVLPAAHRDTVRAALILVIWYGLRGVVAELLRRGRRRSLLLEYGAFVVGAAAVIAVRVLRS
jgi:hypothetical protein